MAILCTADHSAPGLAASIGGEVQVVDGLPAAHRALADRPDETLVVLGSEVETEQALAFAAQLRVERPALGVVLLRDRLDVVTLTQALRAGVREVVHSRELDGLAEACRRSVELSARVSGGPAGPEGPP